VCVRRYERHALTVALTAAEEESDRVAADQVKLLGQVVAFIRRC
jgi:SOS-response transcriptional repressor LexA